MLNFLPVSPISILLLLPDNLLRELFELTFQFINRPSAVSILLLNLIVEYIISSNLKIHILEAKGKSDFFSPQDLSSRAGV